MAPPSTRPTDETHPRRRLARRLRRALLVAGVLAVAAAAAVGLAVKDHLRTLRSLRRVPHTNLYVMDYYGAYHLDEIRRRGMRTDDIEGSLIQTFFPDILLPFAQAIRKHYLPEPTYRSLKPGAEHCTTVACRGADRRVLFGRNMDWHHDACLLLKIHRNGSVHSIAMLDLHYLNMDREDLEHTTLLERIPLLFTPYLVMDGMNVHGVAVSDMSADGTTPPRHAGRPDILHGTDMRLILDYAKSADEAVRLLEQYNVHFVETTCHLMIADASGDTRVVEFIDGQMRVTRSDRPWQVCTNHLLWQLTEEENDRRCERYQRASDRLEQAAGDLDASAVGDILASVATSDWTMWSTIYDLTSGRFRIVYRNQLQHPLLGRMPVHRSGGYGP